MIGINNFKITCSYSSLDVCSQIVDFSLTPQRFTCSMGCFKMTRDTNPGHSFRTSMQETVSKVHLGQLNE